MAISNKVIDLTADLSQAFNKGVSQAQQSLTQRLTQQTTKREIDMQAANLYDDIKTKWKNNITSGQLGEATHNMAKRIFNNNLDKTAIEKEIFTHAGVYAKVNEVEFSDVLQNLEEAITPILQRKGYTELPSISTKSQEEFNKLYEEVGGIIRGAYKNPNFASDVNRQFLDNAYNASLDDLKANLKILNQTGKSLTGNEQIDLNILNTTIAQVGKEQLNQYKKVIQSQIRKQADLTDMSTDNLIRQLTDPRKSVKDIMKPYTNIQFLQAYSRAEAKDMLNEVNYLLQNRAEISQSKPFQTDDWSRLTKLQSDLKDYLKTADAGQDKPLSKSYNTAIDEGQSPRSFNADDNKFIKQRTGQEHLSGINYPRAAEITGQIDDTPVGLPSLYLRKDQISKLLESGTAELPNLDAQFWHIMKMDELPADIKTYFGAPNTAATKGAVFSEQELQDNMFAAMAEDIRFDIKEIRKSKGLKEAPNAMYDKETGDIAGYYWNNNIKLKMLQMYGHLSSDTLAYNKLYGGFPQNVNVGKELLTTKVTKHISDNNADFLNKMIFAEFGEEDFIGMTKVITAYPSYFDRLLSADTIALFEAMDTLGKKFHTTDYFKELPNAIMKGNIENKQELIDLYQDIYNEIMLYTSRLKGKYLTAKHLDLPEGYLIPERSPFDDTEVDTYVATSNDYKAFRETDYKNELEKADYIRSSDEQNNFRENTTWYSKMLDEEGIKSMEETAKTDFIKSTMHLGGQPTLEDAYHYSKYAKQQNTADKIRNGIRNIDKFYKSATTNYDIQDLEDLHLILLGTPEKKGNRIVYPDRFALNNRLTDYVETLDPDRAYGYLLDLKDYVKSLESIYANRLPINPYTITDKTTGLTKQVNMDKLRQSVVNRLNMLETDINRHISNLGTERFKELTTENTEKLAQQGHIVDSTSLDYMMDKGKYDIQFTQINDKGQYQIAQSVIQRKPKKTTLSQATTNKLLDDYAAVSKQIEEFQAQAQQANRYYQKETEKSSYIKDYGKGTLNSINKALETAIAKKNEIKAEIAKRNIDEIRKYFEIDHFILKTKTNPTTQTEKFANDMLNILDSRNWDSLVVNQAIDITEKLLKTGATKSKTYTPKTESFLRDNELLNKYGLDLTVNDKENRKTLEQLLYTLKVHRNPNYEETFNIQKESIDSFLSISKPGKTFTTNQENKDERFLEMLTNSEKRKINKDQDWIDEVTNKSKDNFDDELPF